MIGYNGHHYEIRNLRLPAIFKHVLPLSLRNPLLYVGLQKLSASHIPASCRVEPTLISTFDNKTYSYELNNCYHLLFRLAKKFNPLNSTLVSVIKEGQAYCFSRKIGPSTCGWWAALTLANWNKVGSTLFWKSSTIQRQNKHRKTSLAKFQNYLLNNMANTAH